MSRDYHKRAPETLEAFVRAYLEGVAAAHEQKDRALKVIQKYTRLKEQKLIDELHSDSVKFLERVPRVESEAIAPIVEFMGKNLSPSKPLPTTPSLIGWCAKDLSTSSTRSIKRRHRPTSTNFSRKRPQQSQNFGSAARSCSEYLDIAATSSSLTVILPLNWCCKLSRVVPSCQTAVRLSPKAGPYFLKVSLTS